EETSGDSGRIVIVQQSEKSQSLRVSSVEVEILERDESLIVAIPRCLCIYTVNYRDGAEFAVMVNFGDDELWNKTMNNDGGNVYGAYGGAGKWLVLRKGQLMALFRPSG
ncbi:hypothetical protein K0M31_004311, partial [Melipona bicolor]